MLVLFHVRIALLFFFTPDTLLNDPNSNAEGFQFLYILQALVTLFVVVIVVFNHSHPKVFGLFKKDNK